MLKGALGYLKNLKLKSSNSKGVHPHYNLPNNLPILCGCEGNMSDENVNSIVENFRKKYDISKT